MQQSFIVGVLAATLLAANVAHAADQPQGGAKPAAASERPDPSGAEARAASLQKARVAGDRAKPADQDTTSGQQRSKFNALSGAVPNGWQGFGGIDQARSILQYALQNAPAGERQRYEHYWYAVKNAMDACGTDAPKFLRLLQVLRKAGDEGPQNDTDRLAAYERAVNFLVYGNGTSMTRSILALGLAMCAAPMASYENAYRAMWYVLKEAGTEASTEDPALVDVLGFVAKADVQGYDDCFRAQIAVARAVAESPEGQPLFTRALAALARAEVGSDLYLHHVLWYGLKAYSAAAQDRTHRELAEYLLAWDQKMQNQSSARQVFVKAALSMENLGLDLPPAKVLCQAGLDLSGLDLTTEERYWAARLAMDRVLGMDVPMDIAGILRTAIESGNATNFDNALGIARDALQAVLSR